jgi:hypothetical protein
MWFNNPAHCRIINWRNWREQLRDINDQDLAQAVASNWSQAPMVNYYLVADNCANWPNAWQLINDNIYCDLAKVLGMFYSIALLNRLDPEIKIFANNEGWINLLYLDQGKYILNWNHGLIVNTNIEKDPTANLKPIYSYTRQNLADKF